MTKVDNKAELDRTLLAVAFGWAALAIFTGWAAWTMFSDNADGSLAADEIAAVVVFGMLTFLFGLLALVAGLRYLGLVAKPRTVSQDQAPASQDAHLPLAWGSAITAFVWGLLALGTALAVVISVGNAARDEQRIGTIPLAAALLFGVLTFFFALAALISTFHALGMERKNHALGMPQGSVRAFMALVLIMLFFLMSVFLYLDVAQVSKSSVLPSVDKAAYDQLVTDGNVISARPAEADPAAFDVTIRIKDESSDVAEEMARQLVTVLGTLIVAISAFYFGSGAVQAATDTRKVQERVEERVQGEIGPEMEKMKKMLADTISDVDPKNLDEPGAS